MSKSKKWTLDDWRAWRAENVRLCLEGWTLTTKFKLDGTVEEWAEKNGVRVRRDPNWERDKDDNYICPVT